MANNNKIMRLRDTEGKSDTLSVDELIARGHNKWSGWSCGAGAKNLYIDYDGNVWRCNTSSSQRVGMIRQAISPTDEMFARHKGYLGNINSTYNLPDNWFTCAWKSCPCGADVLIPKCKANEEGLLKVNGPSGGMSDYTDTLHNAVGEIAAVETYFKNNNQILWDIGRRCNFACSYCWPGSHNNTDGHLDWELIKNVSSRIIKEWAHGNQIRWYFGGGEPTLHPNFINWMKWLKDNDQWTLVTSNGSRPSKYWKELAPYLNGINLSVHFEYINEDKLMDNIRVITDYFSQHIANHWLEIKLMSTPASVERAVALRTQIRNSGMLQSNGLPLGSLSLVPIRDIEIAGKIVDYTEDQLKMIAEQ